MFLWPGFSDNSRVLKWMCERIEGRVGARKTPIGLMPEEGDLDLYRSRYINRKHERADEG